MLIPATVEDFVGPAVFVAFFFWRGLTVQAGFAPCLVLAFFSTLNGILPAHLLEFALALRQLALGLTETQSHSMDKKVAA